MGKVLREADENERWPWQTEYQRISLLDHEIGAQRPKFVKWMAALALMSQKFQVYGEIEEKLLDKEAQLAFGDSSRITPQLMIGEPRKITLDEISETELSNAQLRDLMFLNYDPLTLENLKTFAMTIDQYNTAGVERGLKPSQDKLNLEAAFHADNADHVMSSIARYLAQNENITIAELTELLLNLMDREYYVPARSILDCILASGCRVGPEIFKAAVRLAILSGSEELFCTYSTVFDGYRKGPSKLAEADTMLQYKISRFFTKPRDARDAELWIQICQVLCKGMIKFGHFADLEPLVSWALEQKYMSKELQQTIATAAQLPVALKEYLIELILHPEPRPEPEQEPEPAA